MTSTFPLKTAAYTAACLLVTLPILPPPAAAHSKSTDHVDTVHEVSDFDQVEIGGVFELAITTGEDFRVFTSGHEKDVDDMTVSVENGVLTLGHKKKNWSGKNNKDKSIRLEISMPALNALSVGGVATGEVTGIDADDFELNIGGVGDLTLSGTCENLEVNIGGVGNIDAKDFQCENTSVNLAGVGDAQVYASESVDVSTFGVGSVTVWGKPEKVEKSKGFLSSVKIK